MSTSNNMTYQDAYALLINEIYTPVFFDKLASDFGIRPSTEEEAREFLTLSGKLQQLNEIEQTKQASDRVSLVSAASQSIDGLLYGAGGNVPVSQTQLAQEAEIKAAAAKLAQVPQVRDAALLYQDSLRQLMSQE